MSKEIYHNKVIQPYSVNSRRNPLFYSTTLGYFSIDSNFSCLEWNDLMSSWTSCTKDDILNSSILDKFSDFARSDLFVNLSSIFTDNIKEEIVFFSKSFWDSSSFFYFTIIPEVAASEKTNLCHIICQRPVPNTLQQSLNNNFQGNEDPVNLEPYYLIFEKLTIPSIISRYGIIQHANQALLNLLGLSNNSELVGKHSADFVLPSQKQKLNEIIKGRYNGKEIENPLIYDIRKADSTYITCELEVSFVDLPDGLASVVSIHDVSEKIKIQNALIESESKFRRMFESTLVGIIFIDNEGFINDANDRFLSMVDYSREEFNNKPVHWQSITPPQYFEQDHLISEQLLLHRYINPYEKEFYKKDGSKVPVLITASYVESTEKSFGVVFIIDLTEIKKSKEETKEVVNELSTFLYMASHDLKGPLASVSGLTQIAIDEIKDTKSLYYLNLIQECNNKLDKSLLNFLKIIKIKNYVFERKEIDFNTIINGIISDYQHQINSNELTFDISILSKKFHSDEDLMQTILQNLIENAVKYKSHLRKPLIKISIDNTINELQIKVDDNGKGIDDSIKDKIFNLFFRGNSSSKGSGLGLYIVKSVVNNLQGSIDVVSKKEGGSTFLIKLPLLPN